MLDPQNLRVLAPEALLGKAEGLLAGVKAWPAGSALGLVRAGLPLAPDVAQTAAVIDELVNRGGAGSLPHEIRERFLIVYHEFRQLLPEAAIFFDRHRVDMRKMRARSMMLKRVAERRADRRAKALMRVGVDVHPDDVDELRRFAAGLLARRGIEPVPLKRAPGRSQKKAEAPPAPAPAPDPAPALTASPPRSRRPMSEEDLEKFLKSPPPPKAK